MGPTCTVTSLVEETEGVRPAGESVGMAGATCGCDIEGDSSRLGRL